MAKRRRKKDLHIIDWHVASTHDLVEELKRRPNVEWGYVLAGMVQPTEITGPATVLTVKE